MKLIVENKKEAIELALEIGEICGSVIMSNIPDQYKKSYEMSLCSLFESIEVEEFQK